MVKKAKKLPKAFDYLTHDDQIAGGVAFCAGCPLELALRLLTKTLGKDIIIVGTPSCSAPVLYGQNIGCWHRLAYCSSVMTGVASKATGITRYYRKTGQDATVVCFTGDGCAADVGFQPLSGAAERNERFIYVCYDNEGYMNTGIQRSSTTPLGASTTTTPVGAAWKGKETAAKYLPMIMAMHNIPYVATAALGHTEDYLKKLLKAKEMKREGLAYIHVFSPCPIGWGIPDDSAIEVCRRAVKSNYFPLWEMERGKLRITHTVKAPVPVTEFTRLCRKFRHLTAEDVSQLQREIDSRYRFIENLQDQATSA